MDRITDEDINVLKNYHHDWLELQEKYGIDMEFNYSFRYKDVGFRLMSSGVYGSRSHFEDWGIILKGSEWIEFGQR